MKSIYRFARPCLTIVTIMLLAHGCAGAKPVQSIASDAVEATQDALIATVDTTEKLIVSTAGTTRDVVTTVIGPMRSAIYRSEFGDVLKVTYSNRRATLSFNDGTTKGLQQVESSAGFLYRDGETSLWTSDNKVVLEMKGDKTEYTEAEY